MRPPEISSAEQKFINETETSVSYLGVELLKAENKENAPSRAAYENYIEDDFTLTFQRDIAVAFAQGEPLLIEGGTSIGKTTTIKKMAAELGWEVHYLNLNGSTDASDLMGKYVPNRDKKTEADPEYIFADGNVTSGLRQEEGKIKVIILDEYNASSPSNLIRLHEIYDALERGGEIVLSEDASERIVVDKTKTKVVALTNPPGKGYLQRETLDPANLRRLVYLKAPSELPEASFNNSLNALFNVGEVEINLTELDFLPTNDAVLKPEELKDIPGIEEILAKYGEFHKTAKAMVQNRQLGADQPQPFMYDDRMEARRVRDFVCRYFRGDINETFKAALRYFYANKVLSKEDKAKLEAIISLVETRAEQNTSKKRRGLNDPDTPDAGPKKEKMSPMDAIALFELHGKRENFFGPDEVKNTFGFFPTAEQIEDVPFSEEVLTRAIEQGYRLVLQVGRTDKNEPLTMEYMHEKFRETTGIDHTIESGSFTTMELVQQKFFMNETPRRGWKLVAPNAIVGSEQKDYIDQYSGIINALRNEIFDVKPGDKLPEKYQKATDEWDANFDRIDQLSDGKERIKELQNLHITNLTRERISEVLYSKLLSLQQGRTEDGSYIYTNSANNEQDELIFAELKLLSLEIGKARNTDVGIYARLAIMKGQ